MGISNTKDDRNILERFLGLFTDVRGGEGAMVMLPALNVFIAIINPPIHRLRAGRLGDSACETHP